MSKSIPLSVRISEKDAEFLAELRVPEAKTPSDKVRAILVDARRRQEGTSDFSEAVAVVEDMLRPAAMRLRTSQRSEGDRSEFLMKLYERLPELVAELMAGAPPPDAGKEARVQFEAVIATQVFSIVEEILDMGLTSQARCFDPALVRNRLNPILEVTDLVKLSLARSEGEPK